MYAKVMFHGHFAYEHPKLSIVARNTLKKDHRPFYTIHEERSKFSYRMKLCGLCQSDYKKLASLTEILIHHLELHRNCGIFCKKLTFYLQENILQIKF